MPHIDGAAPLPWSRPCGRGLRGRAHFSPLYVDSDSPKADLTACFIF